MSDNTKINLKHKMVANLKTKGLTNKEIADKLGYAHDSTVSEILHKPKTLAYLESKTAEAEQVIVQTMSNKKDRRLAFDAAREVLDRTHGKAVQKTEVSGNFLNVNIDLSGS